MLYIGGFGFVYEVVDIYEHPYALKRMIAQDRDRLAVIRNEISLMVLFSANPINLFSVRPSPPPFPPSPSFPFLPPLLFRNTDFFYAAHTFRTS